MPKTNQPKLFTRSNLVKLATMLYQPLPRQMTNDEACLLKICLEKLLLRKRSDAPDRFKEIKQAENAVYKFIAAARKKPSQRSVSDLKHMIAAHNLVYKAVYYMPELPAQNNAERRAIFSASNNDSLAPRMIGEAVAVQANRQSAGNQRMNAAINYREAILTKTIKFDASAITAKDMQKKLLSQANYILENNELDSSQRQQIENIGEYLKSNSLDLDTLTKLYRCSELICDDKIKPENVDLYINEHHLRSIVNGTPQTERAQTQEAEEINSQLSIPSI